LPLRDEEDREKAARKERGEAGAHLGKRAIPGKPLPPRESHTMSGRP
jgi:hypothetical protein